MEEIVIQANSKSAWEYLGAGFGAISLYDRNVTASIGFSAPICINAPSDKRRIRYPKNDEYIERLIHFNAENKSMTFINLNGFPFPSKKIEVSVEVESVNENTSILRWKLDLKLTYWTFFYVKRAYAKAIRKHYRAQFTELKYFLENNKQKRACNIEDYNFALLFNY